jgi:hypothetical protein
VGEKLGSNEGGTYEKDGTKYYIKFPKNPDQGRSEVLSANLAQLMHIKTTSPVNMTVDNKPAVVSELQALHKVAWPKAVGTLSAMQRLQLARIYYHAMLTKNWDVLGVDASNIMMDGDGNLVLMDTGGSFEFRAQGKHKDYGSDITDTNLFNEALPSGKVFSALMKKDPGSFAQARQDLIEDLDIKSVGTTFEYADVQKTATLRAAFIQRLTKLQGLKTFNMVKEPAKPAAPSPAVKPLYQVTPELTSIENQLITANPDKWPKKGEPGYLDSNQRLRAAAKLAYESDGATASRLIAASIKVPPPPLTASLRQTLSSYVGSSTALNQALRANKGEIKGTGYDEKIKTLDKGFIEARDYSMPVKVMRGMPNSALPHGIKPGDTFVDHGYQSTSFSGEVAKSFGSANTVLRVTLPKGFKFLAIPAIARAVQKEGHNFSTHAGSEAECILPRGIGYQIKKIEQEGNHRVLHVHAIFSAIQPPGTEWVSTRTAKAKAKQQQQGPASGNIA